MLTRTTGALAIATLLSAATTHVGCGGAVVSERAAGVRVFNGENLRVDNRSGVVQELYVSGKRLGEVGVGQEHYFRLVEGLHSLHLVEARTTTLVFKAEFRFERDVLLGFRHEDPTNPTLNFEVHNFFGRRLRVFLGGAEVADLGPGSSVILARAGGRQRIGFQEEGQPSPVDYGELSFSAGTAFYLEYR